MFQTIRRLCALLLLAVTLPACATITSGTSQPFSVITEPAGASCNVQREGAVVAVVNPTPGTIQIGKSGKDLTVRCTKTGYSPGVTSVPSQFQAMAAGNLLLGGIIGAAVDAASGAYARYPETTTVILPPQSFPSALAREEYFAGRIAETRRQYAERATTLRGTCNQSDPRECQALIANLNRERDEAIALLESQRQQSRIGA